MNPRTAILAAALTTSGPGCAREDASGSTADPALAAEPTVIVLVMDGARLQETTGDLPSSATGEMPWEIMPEVWEGLLPEAVRATNAWGIGSSTTVPAHVALLSGRRSPVANYPPGSTPGAYLSPIPLLPQALRHSRPALAAEDAPTIANTSLLELLAGTLYPGMPVAEEGSWRVILDDRGQESHDDAEVLQALREAMEGGELRLAVLNLHEVDRAGHNGDTPDYTDALRSIDAPIAELWAWIQEQPEYMDDTYLLLLSDHGRHNESGTDPPWRHHGCSCSGCRHVPMLLLGPGVRAGEDLDDPVLLTDVAPTLGALLGVPMPWSDGLVRDDLLLEPTGWPSRSGLADLAVAGAHRAELRYLDDPGQRSELIVEGQRLSSAEALVVEAPTMAASDEGAWLCWRELHTTIGASEAAWAQRCARSSDGDAWSELSFAVDEAGPYSRPALLAEDEGVVATWIHNPQGSTGGGSIDPEDQGSTISLRSALLDEHGWTAGQAVGHPSFPTGLSVVRHDGRFHVAVAGANLEGGEVTRHTRRVWLASFTLEAGQPVWTEPEQLILDEVRPEDPYWRVEDPVLSVAEDGRLLLAATGFGSEGSSQAILATSDDGEVWEVSALALPAALLPGVAPVWLGELAVFATLDPETASASLCAGGPGEEAACLDTGSERVLALAAQGDTLHALLDRDRGAWERHQWKASSFTR